MFSHVVRDKESLICTDWAKNIALASHPFLWLSWPLPDINRVGPSLEASLSRGPSRDCQQTTRAWTQAFPESVHTERVGMLHLQLVRSRSNDFNQFKQPTRMGRLQKDQFFQRLSKSGSCQSTIVEHKHYLLKCLIGFAIGSVFNMFEWLNS